MPNARTADLSNVLARQPSAWRHWEELPKHFVRPSSGRLPKKRLNRPCRLRPTIQRCCALWLKPNISFTITAMPSGSFDGYWRPGPTHRTANSWLIFSCCGKIGERPRQNLRRFYRRESSRPVRRKPTRRLVLLKKPEETLLLVQNT